MGIAIAKNFSSLLSFRIIPPTIYGFRVGKLGDRDSMYLIELLSEYVVTWLK
jgi:hypothetical protein